MLTKTKTPLCVNLEGSLVRTSLLAESVFALLRKNFLYVLLLPVWIMGGVATLRKQVAARVDLDPATLPFHETLVRHLQAEHKAGRKLILRAAANEKLAHRVAEHLRLFDAVVVADTAANVGVEPLRARVGEDEYDYVEADMDSASRGRWADYVAALRPHQWVKNLLVFAPLVLAHELHDLELLLRACMAFVAFGACASGLYLFNDLMDLPADRQHPSKRLRPLASGKISLVIGSGLGAGLLVGAFALGALLPPAFWALLGVYACVSLAYSVRLKHAVMVDVIVLAGLYTLRILAGAAAVSVPASFWLLAFSMFLFLSLALVKRFTELRRTQLESKHEVPGRGYTTDDLSALSSLGTASAWTSVLVLALYVNSDAVVKLYSNPEAIWLACPLLLYLMGRIWLLAHRGKLPEDPVLFVIRDRQSQWLAALGGMLLLVAM